MLIADSREQGEVIQVYANALHGNNKDCALTFHRHGYVRIQVIVRILDTNFVNGDSQVAEPRKHISLWH